MERKDFEIGQTVYIEPVCYTTRYGTDIIETKISKIERKYIETEEFGDRHKFNISDGTDENRGYGGYGYLLYLTRQEMDDKNERQELLRNLQRDWYHLNLTLDQLRRIKAIIEEDKEK